MIEGAAIFICRTKRGTVSKKKLWFKKTLRNLRCALHGLLKRIAQVTLSFTNFRDSLRFSALHYANFKDTLRFSALHFANLWKNAHLWAEDINLQCYHLDLVVTNNI